MSSNAAPSDLRVETNANRCMQGAGGGPIEDNVSGLLVRSTSTNWTNGSILGVDPGKHLATIIRIIEKHLPQIITPEDPRQTSSTPGKLGLPALAGNVQQRTNLPFRPTESDKSRRFLSTGPFASLELPHESAAANGAYIVRDLISTHLISHPHLDHIAGLVVNTAGFSDRSRPKRLAALPSTLDAIRDHIFNDIIWPDLSDEAGLLTYMPLVEADSDGLDGKENAAYTEICNGLSVRSWSVSHGSCVKREVHNVSDRHGTEEFHIPHLSTGSDPPKHMSKLRPRAGRENVRPAKRERRAVDSSAFFLRDDQTRKEVLIFGDVEPDSLSLLPRTGRVWEDAAPKVINEVLKGVFIECSYDDSRSDETLFGHLCPRHLMIELGALAAKVESLMQANGSGLQERQTRKRKVHEHNSKSHRDTPSPLSTDHSPYKSRRQLDQFDSEQSSLPGYLPPPEMRLTAKDGSSTHQSDLFQNEQHSMKNPKGLKPLDGLLIIITHVKDTLCDGPDVRDTILTQLREHEAILQLGCDFVIPEPGSSIWL